MVSIVRLEILGVRRERPGRGRAGSEPGRGWEDRSSCPAWRDPAPARTGRCNPPARTCKVSQNVRQLVEVAEHDRPEDIRSVVTVQTVDPPTGGLRHQAVVSSQGEVGTVDVESWLEEDGSVGLQVRGPRPEPDMTNTSISSQSSYRGIWLYILKKNLSQS